MRISSFYTALALGAGLIVAAGAANALTNEQKALIASYQQQAAGDAARGRAFFFAEHKGGKPETPACTTCHTTNLTGQGLTRAGKAIDPMAASVSPKRYTDVANVDKWFRRNCSDVLGRDCSAQEKADILAFLGSI